MGAFSARRKLMDWIRVTQININQRRELIYVGEFLHHQHYKNVNGR